MYSYLIKIVMKDKNIIPI